MRHTAVHPSSVVLHSSASVEGMARVEQWILLSTDNSDCSRKRLGIRAPLWAAGVVMNNGCNIILLHYTLRCVFIFERHSVETISDLEDWNRAFLHSTFYWMILKWRTQPKRTMTTTNVIASLSRDNYGLILYADIFKQICFVPDWQIIKNILFKKCLSHQPTSTTYVASKPPLQVSSCTTLIGKPVPGSNSSHVYH